MWSRKGLALTVGGSQLDDVRHFVYLGWMRSWREEKSRERWREDADWPPLLFHIHRESTGREITENKPLLRELNASHVLRSAGRCLRRCSVRSDARARMQGGCAEELAMRLDKDRLWEMSHSAGKQTSDSSLLFLCSATPLYYGEGEQLNTFIVILFLQTSHFLCLLD